MRRGVVLALLAAAGLALGIAGGPLGSGPASALGWTAAAGVLLMLMLRGGGNVTVGVLLVLIGIGAGAAAAVAGGWALFLLVPALVVAAGGAAAVRWGAGWDGEAGAGVRAAPPDAWKQFDQGVDPTDVVEDHDPR